MTQIQRRQFFSTAAVIGTLSGMTTNSGLAASRGQRSTANKTRGKKYTPSHSRVNQPMVDLYFRYGDQGCCVGLWLPEQVLLGHTKRGIGVHGAIEWEVSNASRRWKYDGPADGQPLSIAGQIDSLPNGWSASLTVRNQSKETYTNVVAAICLLLRGAGPFEDPGWKRTYYRSGGKFFTYHGRETDGGRDDSRMSLVQGRTQLVRSGGHRREWGFTKEQSDDGIIGVLSEDKAAVLTISWNEVHHLQANANPAFRCIHANAYYGRLEPGESRMRHGCVLITPGGLKEAWSETKQTIQRMGIRQGNE